MHCHLQNRTKKFWIKPYELLNTAENRCCTSIMKHEKRKIQIIVLMWQWVAMTD